MNLFGVMQGAIFDLDGTLLDSMWIWPRMAPLYLKSQGITAAETLWDEVKYLSMPELAVYLRKNFDLTETVPAIIDGCFRSIKDLYLQDVTLKTGAAEFLAYLNQLSIPCIIATASDPDLAMRVLNKYNAAVYFSGAVTCTAVGSGKGESSAVFDEAARIIQVPIKNCVVFEDAIHAVATAKSAGYPVAALYEESFAYEWDKISSLADFAAVSFYDFINDNKDK